jgi:hypothetical protein
MRSLRDCLSEDLRRLDPDELFGKVVKHGFGPKAALTGTVKVVKRPITKRVAVKKK